MRVSDICLGKRTIKYGGKSGILPKVRPIFRHNPIRPDSQEEAMQKAKTEQGYAEGVTTPKIRGVHLPRKPVEKPVISVEERLKKLEQRRQPKKDVSEMSKHELWQQQREEIRVAHLKDAFTTEAKRLEKLQAMEAHKRQKDASKEVHQNYEASNESTFTLPTIDSYLEGPIMRPRTEEETAIVNAKRTLNRKTQELRVKNAKTVKLLELYHAAGDFITTEEELNDAIHEAFETRIANFEYVKGQVEAKLFDQVSTFEETSEIEQHIKHVAFGEIDGQPGLDMVKDVLSGEAEKTRREAQGRVNQAM